MKNKISILALVILFSCSNSNEIEESYLYYNAIEFSIKNSENEDLLDPANPNHINTENIRIFYLINGVKQEVFNPEMQTPRNFLIFKHANEYRIGISLNHSETEEYPITFVQWNERDTDTIKVEYKRTLNSTIQQILWLNGQKIWELGDNTIDPFFVLIK